MYKNTAPLRKKVKTKNLSSSFNKNEATSSFKKNPGKGGSPLSTSKINNQFLISLLAKAPAEAGAVLSSPPIKLQIDKKTNK